MLELHYPMIQFLIIILYPGIKLLQVKLLFLAKTLHTLADYTWASLIKLTPSQ